jgi:hypothetical protein
MESRPKVHVRRERAVIAMFKANPYEQSRAQSTEHRAERENEREHTAKDVPFQINMAAVASHQKA